ncbi:NTF2-like protein [Thozetella sp. PMI_491]|nr:NTF2-like protein [Thozetella sp. PMI_491]
MSAHATSKEHLHYTFEDEKAFRHLSYQWAKAYDTKDWELLLRICGPLVRDFYGKLDPSLINAVVPKSTYVAEWSSQKLLGDERVKTQHLLGAVEFELCGRDLAIGTWQIQATHRRFLADGQVAVWIANGYVKHFFDRIDGVWKFGGLQPTLPQTQLGQESYVLGVFPRKED